MKNPAFQPAPERRTAQLSASSAFNPRRTALALLLAGANILAGQSNSYADSGTWIASPINNDWGTAAN